jgi:hypothetical protein
LDFNFENKTADEGVAEFSLLLLGPGSAAATAPPLFNFNG